MLNQTYTLKSLYHRLLFPMIMATCLTGCLTLGKDFSLDTEWIVIGTTTQQKVASTLGIPQEVGVSGDKHVWTYYYFRVSVFEKTSRKELRIFWDKDLNVHSYNLTSSPVSDKQSLLLPSKQKQKSKGPNQQTNSQKKEIQP